MRVPAKVFDEARRGAVERRKLLSCVPRDSFA
jgi:hypothetical protein